MIQMGWLWCTVAATGTVLGQASFWPDQANQASPASTLITNLAQLRGLDRPTAKLGIPVRVQAVVTYCEEQWPSLFVQDGSSAAYVYRPEAGVTWQPGDLLAIEGRSGDGFTPLIHAASIRKIGVADLPPPIETTLSELSTGRYDGLRVRVTTVVHWMHVTYRRLYLHIGDASGRYEVHIPDYRAALPVHLVGARVQMTGITGTKLDNRGHVIGAGMSLARLDEVQVLSPAPTDPWGRATQVINTLMYYHPSTSFGQRTKVRGIVTLNTPSGRLYVEDPSGGCEVRLPTFQDRADEYGQYLDAPRPPDLHVGDLVEVLGYPDVGSYAPILTDAILRKVGTTNLPAPQIVMATNVLNLPVDSRRIRVQGRVVASEEHPLKAGVQQRLTLNHQTEVFFVEYEGTDLVKAPVESEVEATGICSFDVDERRRTVGFRVLLDRPQDLRMLAGPPLVTTRGLIQVGTPAAALILGWVWLLRGQVRRRTLQLRSTNDELRREVQQRVRAEESLGQRVKVTSLSADVALALNEGAELRPMLRRCAELLVRHLGVAVAGIWTLDEGEELLELQVKAGSDAPQEDEAERIPLVEGEIGRIAREKKPRLSNDYSGPSGNGTGMTRERLTSFAGYPLLLEGRVLGVVAVFDRTNLGEEVLQALGLAAHAIALGIERKRAEGLLRASEARFRTVIEHNPAGIVVIDADNGRFVEANEAAERMTGFSRGELCRRGPLRTSPRRQADGRSTLTVARERIAEVLSRGYAIFDWMSRDASGRDFPVETRAAHIAIPGRNLVVASIVDITERKRTEAELRNALERERELGELKTNFVSMVSHEFRTPLEVIISSADILERYLHRLPESERKEHLAAIQHSVRRMSAMMEDVLLLGRFEGQSQTFRPDDLHLPACCRRLADEMRSATGGKCPIEVSLPEHLPLARADESLLRHILTNLISNAVKYSPQGAPVQLHVARDGKMAVLRIIDSGLGIPTGDQPRLFEAFQRGGNTEQIPGTGLGLVIVKRSVDMHGGQIHFTSEEGKGTQFTVRLPVFDEAEV